MSISRNQNILRVGTVALLPIVQLLFAAACGESSADGGGGSLAQGATRAGGPVTTGKATVSSSQVGSSSSQVGSGSAGTGCSESPCKLTSPQCGCPGPTQCSLDAAGMRSCAPAGTVPVGQACASMPGQQCGPGTMCISIPTVGHCLAFCSSDADCVAPGGRCAISITVNGQPAVGVKLCSDNCDPVAQTGCPAAGTACHAQTVDNVGHTSCIDAGPGGEGAACMAPNDCAGGFGCVGSAGASVCRKWCNVSQPQCSAGQSCLPLNPQLVLGPAVLGACM